MGGGVTYVFENPAVGRLEIMDVAVDFLDFGLGEAWVIKTAQKYLPLQKAHPYYSSPQNNLANARPRLPGLSVPDTRGWAPLFGSRGFGARSSPSSGVVLVLGSPRFQRACSFLVVL